MVTAGSEYLQRGYKSLQFSYNLLVSGQFLGSILTGLAWFLPRQTVRIKLRDELLDRKIFTTLEEAQVLIEQWRTEYNQVRPHSSLGYRPPVSEAIMPVTLT